MPVSAPVPAPTPSPGHGSAAGGLPPLTRTIALMNQKGGVGKTTTAVNLAAGVALQGQRVLLIDLDPQAHATLHLGVEVGPDQASAYELLTDPGAPLERSMVETRPNLHLVPSLTDLAGAELELAGVAPPARFTRLRDALDRYAARVGPAGAFDFVFLDCPPSLGVLTLSGLAMAREVFVPMQAHFLALQGLGKLMETVSEVTRAVNPRLKVAGVIVCQHDSTTSHSKEVIADLDAFFEQARAGDKPWRSARVYRPAVRRNIKMAECPSFGQTIFEYAPGCPGALDYRALAERLVSEWDEFRSRQSGAVPAHLASPAPAPPAAVLSATGPQVVTRPAAEVSASSKA